MATLSSNMVNVGVSMVLNDQFSARAGRITDSYRKMMNQMNDLNQGISMSMGAALDKGVEIVKGMYGAYEKYAGVQDTIFLVTKMTGTTMEEGNKLMNLVNEINKQTPVTAEQIASGAKYLAMAGNKMPDIQQMLGPISKLASILGHEIGGKGGVADLLTNIMIGMNIPMSEVSLVTDQIGAAVTGANMSLQDFAQTMQYASATARTLQIPFDKVATTIGMLGNMGIQGSRAGTEFKNAYENMVKTIAGKKRGGQQALASIGMSPQDLIDAKGNMLSLEEVAVKIGESFKKLGITSITEGVKKKGFFFDVYGMRGQSAVIDLVDQYLRGEDRFHELLNRIRSSQGFVEQTNQERMKKSSGIIATFKATWENFVISVGRNLAPLFDTTLGLLTKLLSGLTNFIDKPFGKLVTKFLLMATVVKILTAGFKVTRALLGGLWAPAAKFDTEVQAANTGAMSLNRTLVRTVALIREMAMLMNINTVAFSNAQIALLTKAGMKQDSAGRWVWAAGNPDNRKGFVSKQHIYNALTAKQASTGLPPSTYVMGVGGRVSRAEAIARGTQMYGSQWGAAASRAERLRGIGRTIGGNLKGFGRSLISTVGLMLAFDQLGKWLSNDKDALDANTNALDANTNSLNYSIEARERAIANYFKEAIEGAAPPDTRIVVMTPDGRVLGEGNVGDTIDATDVQLGLMNF